MRTTDYSARKDACRLCVRRAVYMPPHLASRPSVSMFATVVCHRYEQCPKTGERFLFSKFKAKGYLTSFAGEECTNDHSSFIRLHMKGEFEVWRGAARGQRGEPMVRCVSPHASGRVQALYHP